MSVNECETMRKEVEGNLAAPMDGVCSADSMGFE